MMSKVSVPSTRRVSPFFVMIYGVIVEPFSSIAIFCTDAPATLVGFGVSVITNSVDGTTVGTIWPSSRVMSVETIATRAVVISRIREVSVEIATGAEVTCPSSKVTVAQIVRWIVDVLVPVIEMPFEASLGLAAERETPSGIPEEESPERETVFVTVSVVVDFR